MNEFEVKAWIGRMGCGRDFFNLYVSLILCHDFHIRRIIECNFIMKSSFRYLYMYHIPVYECTIQNKKIELIENNTTTNTDTKNDSKYDEWKMPWKTNTSIIEYNLNASNATQLDDIVKVLRTTNMREYHETTEREKKRNKIN